MMGPDEYFGEIGLLEKIPRTATVTAASSCKLLRTSGEDFLRIVNGTNELASCTGVGLA